jgi:hypothetical protein
MAEDDKEIGDWIAAHGVTRCPTAYAAGLGAAWWDRPVPNPIRRYVNQYARRAGNGWRRPQKYKNILTNK